MNKYPVILIASIALCSMVTGCAGHKNSKEHDSKEILKETKEPHEADNKPGAGEEDGNMFPVSY